MSRALLLLALLAGCAVPELDRAGAIVCGTNNLCPQGYSCELGRCCPADAGASCPSLSRACAGTSNGTNCIDAANLFTACTPRGSAACGAWECSARAIATQGFCAPAQVLDCQVPAQAGSSCWNGRGTCVALSQLGLDPNAFFGRPVFCLPICASPAGQSLSQCGPLAVCRALSGQSTSVCAPDCRALGCTAGSTCDRATGSCRQ